MARILRARNNDSPRTPRGMTADRRSGPWFGAEARRRVRGKFGGVRRLMARDPDVALTRDDSVFDQFTDNANPKFDPSKSPGSVRRLDSTPEPPRGSTSGHQKVIAENNQKRTGGKRLKRR